MSSAPLAPPGLAEDLCDRLARIGAQLDARGACCLVAVRDESVTYLTGYTTMTFKMHSRPLIAVVTPAGALIMLVGETEADAAGLRVPGADVRSYIDMERVQPGSPLPDGRLQFAPAAARALGEVLEEVGDGRIAVDGLDAAWPPVGQIARMVPGLDARLDDGSDLVWEARLRKSGWELDRMAAAARVLGDAYRRLAERIAPGQTEREVAREFTICQWEAGAHEVGPLAVVADPSRGLFGAPTDRVWAADELLYVDGAAIVDGYWSDFCRTFAARPAADEERAGYSRVRDALAAAAATAPDGRTAADVGAAAARALDIDPTAVGFGRFGHGIGLHVPEPPSLHPDDPTALADGMVLCVEPAVVHAGLNFVAEEEWVVDGRALRLLSPAAPQGIVEL